MGRPLLEKYNAAVQMYDGGLSLAEIASVFGMSRQSMWDALQRRGVKMRPQKRFGVANVFHRGGRTTGKREARQAMQMATDKGLIKRGTQCSKCDTTEAAIEGHHDDYNKPLTVRWLCKRCHYDWHLHNKAVPLAR